jgi:hypothetical protein
MILPILLSLSVLGQAQKSAFINQSPIITSEEMEGGKGLLTKIGPVWTDRSRTALDLAIMSIRGEDKFHLIIQGRVASEVGGPTKSVKVRDWDSSTLQLAAIGQANVVRIKVDNQAVVSLPLSKDMDCLTAEGDVRLAAAMSTAKSIQFEIAGRRFALLPESLRAVRKITKEIPARALQSLLTEAEVAAAQAKAAVPDAPAVPDILDGIDEEMDDLLIKLAKNGEAIAAATNPTETSKGLTRMAEITARMNQLRRERTKLRAKK